MKQLEYFTTYLVPWLALALAAYAAWLSNPSQVTEHYATAKRSLPRVLSKIAPYFCAAAFVINCVLMPEPISKSWLIGLLLSLLALCAVLAVTWMSYMRGQLVDSLKSQIEHLKLYGKGFEILNEQDGRHYDFAELSAKLHLKTLNILLKQFIKPEDKALATHVRSIYLGEDAVEIRTKLEEMIEALSRYTEKGPTQKNNNDKRSE